MQEHDLWLPLAQHRNPNFITEFNIKIGHHLRFMPYRKDFKTLLDPFVDMRGWHLKDAEFRCNILCTVAARDLKVESEAPFRDPGTGKFIMSSVDQSTSKITYQKHAESKWRAEMVGRCALDTPELEIPELQPILPRVLTQRAAAKGKRVQGASLRATK